MQFNKKTGQYKVLLAILAVVLVFISVISALKNVSGKSKLYSNGCYSLELPENCTIKEDGANVFLVSGDKEIAGITVEENFQYGGNIEKIVANWIGMDTSIESESPFLTDKNDKFHKVVLKTRLSAAQEINGEKSSDNEIHYFYLSGEKLFVDIMVHNNGYIDLIENLIKSFSVN